MAILYEVKLLITEREFILMKLKRNRIGLQIDCGMATIRMTMY